MILTVKRKTAIVIRFKAGASMAEIALWHEQPVWRIEGVIRDALIDSDLRLESIAALNELRDGLQKQEVTT